MPLPPQPTLFARIFIYYFHAGPFYSWAGIFESKLLSLKCLWVKAVKMMKIKAFSKINRHWSKDSANICFERDKLKKTLQRVN